jgi:hypothetical protein
MCAALKARESQAEVLVLDKCGWLAGQILSVGNVAYISPQQADDFARQITQDSHHFNNQSWTSAFLGDIHNPPWRLGIWESLFLETKRTDFSHKLGKGDHDPRCPLNH